MTRRRLKELIEFSRSNMEEGKSIMFERRGYLQVRYQRLVDTLFPVYVEPHLNFCNSYIRLILIAGQKVRVIIMLTMVL